MNLNQRVVGQHIEFEPNTYYASFSGELEAAASIMWALVKHWKCPQVTRAHTAKVIAHCLRAIQEWMEAINFRYQLDCCLIFKRLFYGGGTLHSDGP